MSVTLTTAPGTINLSKNPVIVRTTSTSYSGLENYRVMLKIEVETTYLSGTYSQVAQVECIPDSGGVCLFDIAGILHTALERNTTFQVPDMAAPHPYLSDVLRQFRIKYLEKSGTPQVEGSSTTSSVFSVLFGGVDRHYFGLYDFFSNLDETNALLGYYPSGKSVAEDQQEFLSFINHTGETQWFHIGVRQYAATGAEIGSLTYYYKSVADGPDDPQLQRAWQVIVFPVGPGKLTIDATAVKYTVTVYGRTGTVDEFGAITYAPETVESQSITYYLDRNYQDTPSDLIWFSAFNQPSILRCTGRKGHRMEVDRVLSEQVLGYGYNPLTLSTIQHSREFNYLWQYRSGFLRPEEVDALQELLIENKLLEHHADGNYYRLNLTDRRYSILETKITPNSLEFSAERSLAPGHYMRLRSIVTSGDGGSLWQTNDLGYWELASGTGYLELNS